MKYTLFSAEWCKFCQPVKKLIIENKLPVEIIDIDVDVERALDAKLDGIPTIQHPDGTMQRESTDIISLLKETFNV